MGENAKEKKRGWGRGTDRETKEKREQKRGQKSLFFVVAKIPLFTASYKEGLKKIEVDPAPYIMSPA
jgi:hypothetical protein